MSNRIYRNRKPTNN